MLRVSRGIRALTRVVIDQGIESASASLGVVLVGGGDRLTGCAREDRLGLFTQLIL